MTTMNAFISTLATPEDLWERAEALHAINTDGMTKMHDPIPGADNFSFFRTEDGAGNEGGLLVRRREDGFIDAALLFGYDHESSYVPNIEDQEGAEKQPALNGFPSEEFADAFRQGSPLFWGWEDFPATLNHIFASSAVWFVQGQWHYADNLDEAKDFKGQPIDPEHMVRDLRSAFEGFKL